MAHAPHRSALLLGLGLCTALCVTAHAKDPSPRELQSRLAQVELLAGLTPVEGPGLTVTLHDSSLKAPKGVDPAKLRIREEDVNAVLDALRAAGAEALAVSSADGVTERVLIGTAAREAAGSILINRTPVRAPLRIMAIGDAPTLRQELTRPNGVVRRSGLETLGMIVVEESALLTLPAARNETTPRYARAVGETKKPETKKPEKNPAGTDVRPPVANTDSGSTLFFSGPGSNKYHRPGCRFGERIDRTQRVTLKTTAEAQAAGKVPCPVCHPDQVR